MKTHFIEKCRGCNAVLSQCRCADSNKAIRWGICEECKRVVQEERDSLMAINREPEEEPKDL